MPRMSPSVLVFSLFALIAVPVQGQEGSASASQRLEALKQCRAESDAAARLACYDRETQIFLAAADSGELRVIDKAQVESTRRGLFGFTLPRINIFGGGKDKDDNAEEMLTLESTITNVRQVDSETYLFRIAEGNALWEISNAPSRFIAPKVGDTVVFQRAAFGSYFIRVNKQIGVKGKRVG